jgi:BMFP domain-containing protein YqiC
MEKSSGDMFGKGKPVFMRATCPAACNEVNLVQSGCAAHIEVKQRLETSMQTRNKVFEDISQLMTNAMGVAQGAKDEAETAMKSLVDRWLADRDFVTREEFDAVRAMAQKAREENEVLKARLDALEAVQK